MIRREKDTTSTLLKVDIQSADRIRIISFQLPFKLVQLCQLRQLRAAFLPRPDWSLCCPLALIPTLFTLLLPRILLIPVSYTYLRHPRTSPRPPASPWASTVEN